MFSTFTRSVLPLVVLAALGNRGLAAEQPAEQEPREEGAAEAAGGTYTNPVTEIHLADPAVVKHDGQFLLYGTEHERGLRGHRVYTSPDLVNWTRGEVAYRTERPKVWAPDVWQDPDTGKWYLYWTVDESIGVAVADSPYGPFEDVRQFVDRAIDAHMFRDDDGKLYLYYVKFPGFRITVQPMADPVTPEGDPTVILQPEEDWERIEGDVTEGPWILKRDGVYYMLYSGSPADRPNYAVGYATSDSPTGPFTRAEHNPIVHRHEGYGASEPVYGPGHGSVVTDGAGELWHVYHQKRNDRQEWTRFIAIDPLWFDEEGRLHGRATRGVPQPAPTPLAGPRRGAGGKGEQAEKAGG